MKFSIIINGAPGSSPSALSALHFAEAVLDAGHDIYRLFFYQDGVHNASAYIVPPQDELDIPRHWQELIERYQIDAVVCAASALKRGILDADEAERYDRTGHNLRSGFSISGLGQLVDAIRQSDRLVDFAV